MSILLLGKNLFGEEGHMTARYLTLTIGIVLTALTLSAAMAGDEGDVGEKIQEIITLLEELNQGWKAIAE